MKLEIDFHNHSTLITFECAPSIDNLTAAHFPCMSKWSIFFRSCRTADSFHLYSGTTLSDRIILIVTRI